MEDELAKNFHRSVRALVAGLAGGIAATYYNNGNFLDYAWFLLISILLLLIFEKIIIKFSK